VLPRTILSCKTDLLENIGVGRRIYCNYVCYATGQVLSDDVRWQNIPTITIATIKQLLEVLLKEI
jgi:hypothetical protein